MQAYNSSLYRIDIKRNRKTIRLRQYLKTPVIHTSQLPATFQLLEKHIPTIFQNQCFNDKKIPFSEEAKNTEIGHLLEHLVLEYLKLEAERNGVKGVFNGETSWDWSRYGKGTFNIHLTFNKKCYKFFPLAFEKAIVLMNRLYNEYN